MKMPVRIIWKKKKKLKDIYQALYKKDLPVFITTDFVLSADWISKC